MSRAPLRRRDFIELATVLVAAASVGVRPDRDPAGSTSGLARVFGHAPAAARAIGQRYLRDFPEENDAGALVGRILEGVPDLPREVDASEAADLRARFRRRFAADFESGDTVQLDGWILSRTEARLCALCAVS
jgi:hypothetical protein